MEKIRINKNLIHVTLWTFIALIFGLGAGLSAIYLYISPNLPAIESLREVELQTPLRIYSIDNKLIGEFGEKRRDPIDIEEAPQKLIDAILAAEDDAFYDHGGVDFKGLLRAVSQLVLSGEIQSGGSTITMQVARNFFLSREQTFSRKFNEIFLAMKIEKYLNKQEILELYLNKIYLGNRAYGVKAAAQVYYGKDLQDLSTAQFAMIAGLPKAPSTYNPIANPSRALIRRNWILKRMVSLNKIQQDDYELAVAEPVSARYFGQNLEMSAPYVAEAAREKALELFGDEAYTNGYQIVTTIDSRLQKTAQEALINGLMEYDLRHGYRGAEQQLDLALLKPLETKTNDSTGTNTNSEETPSEENTATQQVTVTIPNANADTQIITDVGPVNLIPWLEELKKIPTYGPLEPGVVIRISNNSISVLNAAGQTVDIAWENGLKGTRRYVNENFSSDPPTSPEKLVKLGDVIRMYSKADGEKGMQWYFSQIPDIESALISMRPEDGAIRAMVGGFDFQKSSFNRVTQAKRQPGSNFKPFIYTVALENGMTPASIVNDAPIVVQDYRLEDTWRPENASGKFYGPTRVRKALYLSRNLVSIRLLRSVGIDKAIASMGRFGIDTESVARDLSMALGSHVMTPLEVATAYSVYANGGYKVEPYLIHHIRDRHNTVLFTNQPLSVPNKMPLVFDSALFDSNLAEETNEEQTNLTTKNELADSNQNRETSGAAATEKKDKPIRVTLEPKPATRIVDERIVYLINSMLKDVVDKGTAKRAQSLNRDDLAGKTGTTNGPLDAWFSGYNSQIVTTAWVGFDDNRNIGRGEYGGVAALPIWIDYMKVALEGMPSSFMQRPDGIVSVNIDPETGERALPSNPNSIEEIFLSENVPAEIDPNQLVNGGTDSPAPEELF